MRRLVVIWSMLTTVAVLTASPGPAAGQAHLPDPETAQAPEAQAPEAQAPEAQAPETTVTTLRPAPGGLNNVLGPRPGEEIPPESAGDRGGWLQLALLGALVGGLAVIGTLVVRDARRSRDRAAVDNAR